MKYSKHPRARLNKIKLVGKYLLNYSLYFYFPLGHFWKMGGIFVGWLVEVDAYFSASGWWKPTYLHQVVYIVISWIPIYSCADRRVSNSKSD
jgi:hypothetical protein